MGIEGTFDWRIEAASALEWWRDAGVDVIVEDAPRDWTARDAPSAAPAPDAPDARPSEQAETPLPATLESFVDWRFGIGAPEAAWGGTIFRPQGDFAAPLMVFTDLPETDDAAGDTLLTGPAGRLFDRMLAAIGHNRDMIHLAPLCAAHPLTGQIPRDWEARLGELARHHIALAAPERVLLLGQSAGRAILGTEAGMGRGRLQQINYPGGQSLVVATFAPRFLLTRPAAKADAWKDLQLLIGGQIL